MADKQFFLSRERFIAIAIILIVMWLGLMIFFYLKADEVTKNPCQICAERVAGSFQCFSLDGKYEPISFINQSGG